MTGEEVRRTGAGIRGLLVPMAWALAVVAIALALLLLGMLVAWSGIPGVGPDSALEIVPVLLYLTASPIVGALIISRVRAGHAIGWLFIVSSGALAFGFVIDTYATHAVAVGDDLATATLLRWFGTWSSVPAFASLPLFALLFPDGRPSSRRWAPVIWTSVAGGVLLVVSEALRPDVIIFTEGSEHLAVPNPIGVTGMAPVMAAVGGLALALILGSAVLATVGLVLRFRRSRGIERQQLKWFVFATGTLATLLVASALTEAVAAISSAAPMVAVSELAWVLAISSLVLLPLAAGFGILRYRLYDIDVLINRTLVYGVVSAILGAAYVLGVVLFQSILRPFTAGSELAIAVSTLLVAALFQPVRSRVQSAVDRRFYRARYDAVRTLDAFTARLRNEVELDAVRAELLVAVGDTVRPAHASVWLR